MRPILLSSLGRPKSLMALFIVGIIAVSFPTVAHAVKDVYPHTTWWTPVSQGDHTQGQDLLFSKILWLTVTVNILVFLVMGYFLVKYAYKEGRQTKFIHGNNKLEAVWTLIPTLIMALIAVYSHATWAEMKYPQTEESINAEVAAGKAMRINVFGKQFAWYVQYPGPDGVLGKIDPRKYRSGSTNEEMIGLERVGAGKDDIVLQELVVPVNMKIHVRLQSVDVLHSFTLQTLRIKQDAVPGSSGKLWFKPTKTNIEINGTSPSQGKAKLGFARKLDLVCAELCGAQHYTMRADFFVVTKAQFEDYINGQSPVNESSDEDGDDGGF